MPNDTIWATGHPAVRRQRIAQPAVVRAAHGVGVGVAA
jgi:hypothetical protein